MNKCNCQTGFVRIGGIGGETIKCPLHAAAPEMLAAISDAVENCETCRGEKGPRKCARCQTFEKLIAKAEGR